jgi:hypothetical protein
MRDASNYFIRDASARTPGKRTGAWASYRAPGVVVVVDDPRLEKDDDANLFVTSFVLRRFPATAMTTLCFLNMVITFLCTGRKSLR